MTDLVIKKPITIKGSPGTTLEITEGSITVDFDEEERGEDILVICELSIVMPDRSNPFLLFDDLDKMENMDTIEKKRSSFKFSLELSP